MDLEFNWEGGMEEPGFNELLFNKKSNYIYFIKFSTSKFYKSEICISENNNKHSSNAKNKNKELTEEEKKEQVRIIIYLRKCHVTISYLYF